MTLVEMLIASAMGVIVLGAVGQVVISTMRSQPEVSERANNIATARWVLERLTREIRNGVVVEEATPSTVVFRTFVRRTACGSGDPLASGSPAIQCRVTYTCSGTSCTRTEANPDLVGGGTSATIFSGIDDANVFSWSPAEEPTYIGITLHLPNPSGPGDLTISDGANLRNATLDY